jgi:cation diffusion facilitator CzcD-associated flavoprotein CzcO
MPDVVVVGAGLSGLTAARRLAGSGRALALAHCTDVEYQLLGMWLERLRRGVVLERPAATPDPARLDALTLAAYARPRLRFSTSCSTCNRPGAWREPSMPANARPRRS